MAAQSVECTGVATADHEILVIIPHLNTPDLLGKALVSIQEQTFTNWHCVVVDDHSDNETEVQSVRSRFADKKISWLRTDRTVGQFRIINKLAGQIAAPYFALQDSDDTCSRIRLEMLYREMQRLQCDIIGSAVEEFSSEGNKLFDKRMPLNINKRLSFFCRRNIFIGSTMLCKTSFASRINWFDGTTRFGGDTDFIYRAVFAGKVRNCDHVLYQYRRRLHSLTYSPQTGFQSKARIHYERIIRYRFYRNLFLKWCVPMLLNWSISGKSNNIAFTIEEMV